MTTRYYPKYRLAFRIGVTQYEEVRFNPKAGVYGDFQEVLSRKDAYVLFKALMESPYVRDVRVLGCPLDAEPVVLWTEAQEHARETAKARAAFHAAADADANVTNDPNFDLGEIEAERRANCY